MSLDKLKKLAIELAHIEAGASDTILPSAHIFQRTEVTVFEAVIYNPVICLILQGRKEINVGQQFVELGEGDVLLVETPSDVSELSVRDPEALAYVTQTTLSVDDTAEVVAALKSRFPAIKGPHKEDICYATTNRQEAVKAMAERVEAMLVVGAPNSSNSRRLVEVGRKAGCSYAQLVQRADEIDWNAFEGVATVGITAGASAPEVLVNEVIDAFKAHFDVTLETIETAKETIEFKVPRVLRTTS